MTLDIDTAIRIWITDEGYRKINSYLSGSKSRRDYIYHQTDNENINFENNDYKTIDIINTIKNNMKESNKVETYYRGGSENSKKSYIKKSFISVTTDEEQAKSFVDECCLYKITVEPSVKRYNTGVENEVLLENNLYWDYIGKENNYYLVNISNETNVIQHETNVIQKEKNMNEDLTEEELNTMFEDYKDECSILDIEMTPDGFIDYISNVTSNKNKISYEKAKQMIQNISGGKKYKKINKTKKHRKSKINKKIRKNKKSKKIRKNKPKR